MSCRSITRRAVLSWLNGADWRWRREGTPRPLAARHSLKETRHEKPHPHPPRFERGPADALCPRQGRLRCAGGVLPSPDRSRHLGPRALRHDRRGAAAHGGRTSSRRGADGRGSRRARAGDRRRRQQQHRDRGRAGALGGTRRRPGAALRHAALSQADPGGHDGAFPHHPRRGRPSHHPLRRALAHRLRPGRRDHPTARRTAAHRGTEGRHGRYPAGGAPAPPAGRRIPAAVRRRCQHRRRSACPAATAAFR